MSMAAVTLGALLSHWRRNLLQLAMLLMGLALATALWSGVQALNAEARSAYASASEFLGAAELSRLEHPQGWVAQSEYVALRRAGWQVSPVLEGRADLGGRRVTLSGFEPLTAPPASVAATPALADGDLGAFIGPPGQGFAHPETARTLEAPEIAITADEAVPVGTVLVDIGVAQRLLGAEGRVSHMLLHPDQPRGLPPLEQVAPDLRLIPPDDSADLAALTDSFHLNLTAFGLLAFAVGLFIVHAAIGLAFEQRRAVFRTLRALGVPLRTLTVVLAGELLVLALVAGAAGLVLGYGVAAFLLPDVAASLRGLYGAPVPGELRFDPVWAGAGLAMALGGALVAGGRSLWALWRLPLLAPAQPRAWAVASARSLRRQLAGAGVLAVVAAGLALWGQGLLAGFTLLAALLLAAALAVPPVLAGLIALAGRTARGPLSEWVWADARQQLPRLSLALMALMLALAANVGVSTMVGSFRATFIGWLDQRLVAEAYVTARTESEAAALRDWLAPRVDAILPVWRTDVTVAGQPVQVYGTADHASYRNHWPLLEAAPGAWDRLAAGDGVLVNEQLARSADLWPGAEAALPGAGAFEVVAVYSDYGNPRGQVMLGIDPFLAAYPDAPRVQHALRVTPDAVPDLLAGIQDEFGIPPALMSDQASAKELSLSIFERTFAVTRALNVLTLSVAALALLASLATLSGLRRVQLAPLWALGLTRARLSALDLGCTLALAGLTALLAVPVGVLLAQVLLAVINVQAFGWRLPLVPFPADWARLVGWALLAAFAAAAIPALRFLRRPQGDLLRVFAAGGG